MSPIPELNNAHGFGLFRLDPGSYKRSATAPPLGSPTWRSACSPTIRQRRSVASMRGLMPLTLSISSPSLGSLHSNSSAESLSEPVDNIYLPELLASDLDASTSIFAAKEMTAGSPSADLSVDERSYSRASRMLFFSASLAEASAKVQSLGAIEERESLVSFIESQDERYDGHLSTSESITGSESLDDAVPPAFTHRASVVTAATSVASASWTPPKLRRSIGRSSSWIDIDSEDEDVTADEPRNAGSLAPRPPTPPDSDPDSLPGSELKKPTTWDKAPKGSHRRSHSVSGGSPVVRSRRQFAELCLDAQVRPSTAGRLENVTVDEFAVPARSSSIFRTSAARRSTPHLPLEQAPMFPTSMEPMPEPQSIIREPTPVEDNLYDSEIEDETQFKRPIRVKPSVEFMRMPTPPPLRSVQSWLNNSLQPYPWPHQTDDSSNAVPLPPDAMETLRVSVACFPETMLLSTSLTTETIRSYARKVRHPADQLEAILAEPVPPSPRKSLWHKMTKRSSPEPRRPMQTVRSLGNVTVPEVDGPKLWAPIKNVFGGACSDYICDALYAHIVAYNYISAVVSRNPTPPQSTTQDDIPKKAASLLGLSGGLKRPLRRMSTPFGEMVRKGSPMPISQDSALRNIHGGLMRCISRLVATARLMAENGICDDRMVDMEAEDPDVLFTRSLCEIVKMAEEA